MCRTSECALPGQITHILTAELIPLPHVVTSHFPHMAVLHVAIADLSESDLLGELEPCVKFIRYVPLVDLLLDKC